MSDASPSNTTWTTFSFPFHSCSCTSTSGFDLPSHSYISIRHTNSGFQSVSVQNLIRNAIKLPYCHLLTIDDSTPVSQSRHTLRFQPIACRSIMRCPRVLTRPEMVWQAFVPDAASSQLAVFDMAEKNPRKTELLLWPV